MDKLLNFLAQRKTVLGFLALMILLNIGFSQMPKILGGNPLDILMNMPDTQTRMDSMSAPQKKAHIWMTWTLDALYPLVYCGFFAGLTARFSKRSYPLRPKTLLFFILPAFIALGADYVENIVQTMALLGLDDLLVLKTILTPLKFMSVAIAAIIALSFFILAAIQKIRKCGG